MPDVSMYDWRTADPLDFTSKYNTPIPPEKQAAFNQWVVQQQKKTGRNPLNDRYDYDVNGLFLSGQGTDQRGHSTDQFKKPNHPTFSDESIYNGKDGYQGGRWITQAGQTFYEPSTTNVALHGVDKLKSYFQQVDPQVQLLAPPLLPSQILQGVIR